jgi:hypothetical protein
MATKLKVLIDLNLILDTLQKREPFYAYSAWVLACAETGAVERASRRAVPGNPKRTRLQGRPLARTPAGRAIGPGLTESRLE